MLDELQLYFRRYLNRRRRTSRRGYEPTSMANHMIFRTLALGLTLALLLIGALELRVRPVVEQMSAHQVNNQMTGVINTAITRYLDQAGDLYADLTVVEKDGSGKITAISSEMTQINRLRGQLVEEILQTIAEVDTHTMGIPLGNLFDMDLLWAKGPRIGVRSLVSGTVQADVNSYFEARGINQTLHRIMLHVCVPLTVMLPGCRTVTQVETSVCVAETVIVGTVPGTYLQIDGSQSVGN